MPQPELVHLLEFERENLEMVEVEIDKKAPSIGKRVDELKMPNGAKLISVVREGAAESPWAPPSSRPATGC